MKTQIIKLAIVSIFLLGNVVAHAALPDQNENSKLKIHLSEAVNKTDNRINLNYSSTKKHKHLKEIQAINDRLLMASENGISQEDRSKNFNDYLSNLDSNGLLEVASELADVNDLESSGISLIPHLKKRLSEKFPSSDFYKIIKDKKQNNKFRAFLIDIVTKFSKVEANNIVTSNSSSDTPNLSTTEADVNNNEICETLISLAEDKANDAELRRYALLQLGKKNSSLGAVTKDEDNRLLKIFRDDDSPLVRGAVITTMRRMKSSNLGPILDEVLAEPEDFYDIEIRHAVVSAAKSDLRNKYIANLKKIAITKNNNETYQSTIYALGLIGNIDAICAIADAYQKYGSEPIIRSAFRKNGKIILLMLDPANDDYTISCGLKAVKIGRISTAKELIESIAMNSKNKSLRDEAGNILDEIDTYEVNAIQYKWEARNDN